MPTETVLITGATSFVGSAIASELLSRGHVVHATYRPQSAAGLPKFADRLRLFEAHLDKPADSFEKAAVGCSVVIHVAAPMDLSLSADEIIRSSVQGTQAVLDACTTVGTVKTVIMFSSFAAVSSTGTPSTSSKRFSEDDWNAKCSQRVLLQSYGKVRAEQTAWKWFDSAGKSNGPIRLIVLNPVCIWGKSLVPSFGPYKDFLVSTAKNELRGIVDFSLPVVHIGDVVNVVMRFLFSEQGQHAQAGRYIVCPSNPHHVHIRDVVVALNAVNIHPPSMDMTDPMFTRTIKLASYIAPGGPKGQFLRANLGLPLRFSNEKLMSVFPDLEFSDTQTTLNETIEEIIERGLITSA